MALFVIRIVARRRSPPAAEVIDIQIKAVEQEVLSADDLKLRETVRGAVERLGLGRAIPLRHAKTGQEFMHVWLCVPHAEAVVAEVERALSAYPVRVRALGPPLVGGTAILRRTLPAVWRGLVANWHETRR